MYTCIQVRVVIRLECKVLQRPHRIVHVRVLGTICRSTISEQCGQHVHRGFPERAKMQRMHTRNVFRSVSPRRSTRLASLLADAHARARRLPAFDV